MRAGLLLLVVLLTAALAVGYMWPSEHSFLIETTTFSAEVESDGAERAVWHLRPGAVICRRRVLGASGDAYGAGHPECDPGLYDVQVSAALNFAWPPKSLVRLSAGQAGELVIDIVATDAGGADLGAAGGPLPQNSRLIVPQRAFAESGVLPFSGSVQVGAVPDAGERGLLQAGSYSIRQALPLRSNPVAVASGELNLGDRVSFVLADQDPTVFGFVAAFVQETDEAVGHVPFRLTAYTELANSGMRIERFASRPTTIAPSWPDRALRDPWLLGATVILTLSVALISLFADARSFLQDGDGDDGDGSAAGGP